MWYTFELQDTYMYLYLDHDWINLSKPWLFNYFSLWIPNRPTGLPSTLWHPVPVVLLHSFNWPTCLWHHIPVHQHLSIQVPWMLTILHHFLLFSNFPYLVPWFLRLIFRWREQIILVSDFGPDQNGWIISRVKTAVTRQVTEQDSEVYRRC